mmetsp:Transcript_25714/g.75025  ORF Transcript_25714/g.75025 Transcript_25714/m.75025 type:complete len:207 (-) Transcript_25714:235-855(-)
MSAELVSLALASTSESSSRSMPNCRSFFSCASRAWTMTRRTARRASPTDSPGPAAEVPSAAGFAWGFAPGIPAAVCRRAAPAVSPLRSASSSHRDTSSSSAPPPSNTSLWSWERSLPVAPGRVLRPPATGMNSCAAEEGPDRGAIPMGRMDPDGRCPVCRACRARMTRSRSASVIFASPSSASLRSPCATAASGSAGVSSGSTGRG